ncbi:MAG: hypothetical protein Q7K16_02275 [Candidatus Azambacteria bacterium]|nr:hypothetical protein [Candidatus Azambacteria bacterium]
MDEKIKKISNFPNAAFAVWPFEPTKNFERFHNRIVILGLNPSAKIVFGQNFHTEGHRFDGWYQEGFSKRPFYGAYMTDLISHHEVDSKIIVEKWKKDAEFKKSNIENLQNQFDILGVTETTAMVCLGYNTRALFSLAFVNFTNVFAVRHPNGIRVKNPKAVFLSELENIGRKINEIN